MRGNKLLLLGSLTAHNFNSKHLFQVVRCSLYCMEVVVYQSQSAHEWPAVPGLEWI
jgi:hypothetical protein